MLALRFLDGSLADSACLLHQTIMATPTAAPAKASQPPQAASLLDAVLAVAGAADMASPTIGGHHYRVALHALTISRRIGLSLPEQRDILMAALLHDTGAFSLDERLDALTFELSNPEHAEAGYRLMTRYGLLASAAPLIRHHHDRWDRRGDNPVPLSSGIINLADRLDVLTSRPPHGIAAFPAAFARIRRHAGTLFPPELMPALEGLGAEPSHWDTAASPNLAEHIRAMARDMDTPLDLDELLWFSRMLSQVIDFRSRFTATHSRGVAAVAVYLAGAMGFPPADLQIMEIAANLHDVGKLAVPREILEKPGPLDPGEAVKMRSHADHTRHVLRRITGNARIRAWGGDHHERLDGSGYPDGLSGDAIDTGSRIVALADVFVAVTEDRPYRPGMNRDQTLAVLDSEARAGLLDLEVVRLLKKFYHGVNEFRITNQRTALEEFTRFHD
jgi:HD-GYP domain-containing protein (c-di-GMP phosphodiesterase class II)